VKTCCTGDGCICPVEAKRQGCKYGIQPGFHLCILKECLVHFNMMWLWSSEHHVRPIADDASHTMRARQIDRLHWSPSGLHYCAHFLSLQLPLHCLPKLIHPTRLYTLRNENDRGWIQTCTRLFTWRNHTTRDQNSRSPLIVAAGWRNTNVRTLSRKLPNIEDSWYWIRTHAGFASTTLMHRCETYS